MAPARPLLVVLPPLATLAFDYPSRAPFFRSELEQYLLLAREKVAWGETAAVLTADNMLKARRMCEAFDERAPACAA